MIGRDRRRQGHVSDPFGPLGPADAPRPKPGCLSTLAGVFLLGITLGLLGGGGVVVAAQWVWGRCF